MPSLQCPIDDCAFATADVDVAASVVLMQIHASAAHPPAVPSVRTPRAPRMERPTVDYGIDMVTWNNFVRRWNLFKIGSEIDDASSPRQLIECATEKLSDVVLKADPAIATKGTQDVLRIMRSLAVIPVAASVLRAELTQMRQEPDEPFRAFAARAQGKAETCEFYTTCLCTCGGNVQADYTREATRDVLLAGIADADIRREVLGTVNIHRQAINDVIALVEGKEIARNALPSSVLSAVSSFKRASTKLQADRQYAAPKESPETAPPANCANCRKSFEPINPRHKFCKVCWTRERRLSREYRRGGRKQPQPPAATSTNVIEEPAGPGQVSSMSAKQRCRRQQRGCIVTLEHHIFQDGEWRRAQLSSHPTVCVNISIDQQPHRGPPSRPYRTSVTAIPDSGAQSNIWSLKEFEAAGFPRSSLSRVAMSLRAANASTIPIDGAFFAKVDGQSTEGKTVSCRTMIYVSSAVNGLFLSYATMRDLQIIGQDFPSIGSAKSNAVNTTDSDPTKLPSGNPQHNANVTRAMNAGCGAKTDIDGRCDCPQRTATPTRPDRLPFPCIPANNSKMKSWLLDRYAASTFNTCPHRPLPCMTGPPVEIHLDADATPRTCHVAAPVPLHWQREVYEDLVRDEALGVIEKVPYGEPVDWCHRMVVTRKHNGSPRRTVDLSPLNKFCKRETFATESPFHLARRIPGNTWKTVTDAWNGYHSVPLRASDRHLTTFITPFGRWRYTRAPQGFLSSGDGYNRRFDAIISSFERKERCVDDTIHYDEDLESHWWRTIDFLETVGNAGIVLNPDKFQFASRAVDFAGFHVSESSIEPLPKYVDAIRCFPTPKSTTDIRSWFGLVNQVANYAQLRDTMAPFRPFLSPKQKFTWTAELDEAFESSKTSIINSIKRGVEIFDVTKRTCLRPDFSNLGIGYFLLQQHCSCPLALPGCCPNGWKTTLAGSRFLSSAESRYAPVEGEALAVAWGLEQTRYFTQGCGNLVVVTDHKPLVKILGDRTLDEIHNTRLFRLKQRTLPWHFEIAHLPGKSNYAADAASRHPSTAGTTDEVLSTCNTSRLNDALEVAMCVAIQEDAKEVSSLQWNDIAVATQNDDGMRALESTIRAGFPREHRELPHAAPFWRYRNSLYVSEGVIMYEDRVVIPRSLRRKVLENLHAAHQGQSSMELRARTIVFWPGMTEDISQIRARCEDCNRNAPSQAPLPSVPAVPPATPFEAVFADFFDYSGRHFLVLGDRLSGWVEVYSAASGTSQGGAAGLIQCLRSFVCQFGVPDELSSDGGPEFTANATTEFLSRWGIRHRVSSAYHPQSNGRAEVAVKSAKRLLRANVSPSGSLNSDRFLRAMLQLRNTPDPDCGMSPAEIVFGRNLRDSLAFVNRLEKFSNPNIRPTWREAWAAKETALRARFTRSADALNEHARPLPPLRIGDRCHVQNQTGNSPGRWDKSGVVVDALAHDQYVVKLDGSGRVTTRNRRFLRKFLAMDSRSPPLQLPLPGLDTAPQLPERVLQRAVSPSSLAVPELSPTPSLLAAPEPTPTPSPSPTASNSQPTSLPQSPRPGHSTSAPVDVPQALSSPPRRPRRHAQPPRVYDAASGLWV